MKRSAAVNGFVTAHQYPSSSRSFRPECRCIEVGAYLLINLLMNIWSTADQVQFGID